MSRIHLQPVLVFLTLITSMQVAAQSAASPDENRRVVTEFLERVNRGDAPGAAEFFAEDTRHAMGSAPQAGVQPVAVGKANRIEVLQDIFTTFPDWKMDVIEMVAVQDSVIVRCRVSGTHLGIGKRNVNGGYTVGVAPTRKHFEVMATHWFKLRDGKIAEHFPSRDDLGMSRQLGLIPPPLTAAGKP